MTQEGKIKAKAVDQRRDKRRNIDGFEFSSPPFVHNENAIEPSETLARTAFEGVTSQAIELARRNRLEKYLASATQLRDEAKWLEPPSNLNSGSGFNFRQFVERVVSDTKMVGLPPVRKNLLRCWISCPEKKQCFPAIDENQRHYAEG